MFVRRTAERSYPSGAAVADPDLVPLDDDGNLALAAGVFQHLLEFPRIRLDVVILGPGSVSRPGLIGVGSAGLSVDNDFSCHGFRPSSQFVSQGLKNSFRDPPPYFCNTLLRAVNDNRKKEDLESEIPFAVIWRSAFVHPFRDGELIGTLKNFFQRLERFFKKEVIRDKRRKA